MLPATGGGSEGDAVSRAGAVAAAGGTVGGTALCATGRDFGVGTAGFAEEEAAFFEFGDCGGRNFRSLFFDGCQDDFGQFGADPAGNYVFGFSGIGTSRTNLSTAGLWTMDGAGNINNGLMDVSDETAGVLENSALSGTYAVASNGRGTATINSGYGTQNFVFYVVDATDLKFVETDGVPAISAWISFLLVPAPYKRGMTVTRARFR